MILYALEISEKSSVVTIDFTAAAFLLRDSFFAKDDKICSSFAAPSSSEPPT